LINLKIMNVMDKSSQGFAPLFLAVTVLLCSGEYATGLAQQPPIYNPPDMLPIGQGAQPSDVIPVSYGMLGVPVYDMGPLSAALVAQAQRDFDERFAGFNPGPARAGVVRTDGVLPLPCRSGMAQEFVGDDGEKVWAFAVRSPGAQGIRLRFSEVHLAGASLTVYSPLTEHPIVFGPQDRTDPRGELEIWTSVLPGDTVVVEVSGDVYPEMILDQVVHLDRASEAYGETEDESLVGACDRYVECFNDTEVNQICRQATGRMNFTVGTAGALCSGTLLNDLDDETFVSYFLTANHCLSTQAAANTLTVVWFYEAGACGGTDPGIGGFPSNTGATLLETQGSNDFTFLRLDGELPGGIGFSGWTTSTNIPADAHGIHHPLGNAKEGTLFSKGGYPIYCFGFLTANYEFTDMQEGRTQPGSSGSGLFDLDGHLYGQLRGICCDPIAGGFDCSGINCSNLGSSQGVYGEFEETHPEIEYWLDLGGTIYVDSAATGTQNGTQARPFDTVAEGANLAWDGCRLIIDAGNYSETMTITKEITILSSSGSAVIGS
jgi:hypothetical protein